MSPPEHIDPTVQDSGPGRPILFCDTETDGMTSPWLPGGRRVWEVAAIRREPNGSERQFHGFIRLDELGFDADYPGDTRRRSLDIGTFYQRHPQIVDDPDPRSHPNVYSYRAASEVLLTHLLPDKPALVGAVPSFDAESLLHLLHIADAAAVTGHLPWADRLVCVWSLAAGRLGIPPHAMNRELIQRELGIDASRYAHHTALDDTRWVKDVYDTLTPT